MHSKIPHKIHKGSGILSSLFRTQPPGIVYNYNHYAHSNLTAYIFYGLAGCYFTYRFCQMANNTLDASKARLGLGNSYVGTILFNKNFGSTNKSENWLMAKDVFTTVACGLAALMVFNFSLTPFRLVPQWWVIGAIIGTEYLYYNSHLYSGTKKLYNNKSEDFKNLNVKQDESNGNKFFNKDAIANFLKNQCPNFFDIPIVDFGVSIVKTCTGRG